MDVFLARQPIFDRKEEVVAYELLFRNGLENCFELADGDRATAAVMIRSFVTMGAEVITRGKKAYINFTGNLLTADVATLFPKSWMAVELLETIAADDQVVACCRRLKDRGYTLVLDDVTQEVVCSPLLALADVVKVDFMKSSREERARFSEICRSRGVTCLAEKVETRDQFAEACENGYELFQGYYFCQPEILTAKEIPSQKLTHLRILHEIHRPDIDFDGLETEIKRDVALAYHLLKFINSPFFGLRRTVDSIKQALVLLGQNEVRKWFTVILLSAMGQDRPAELVVQSVVRARFCELLTLQGALRERSSDLFLTGLFSLIDVIVGRPMEEVLGDLPVAGEVKEALLGRRNPIRQILELALAHESGDWGGSLALSGPVGVAAADIAQCYLDSLAWANSAVVP